MEPILKIEWLAELLTQHRDLVTEYWIQDIRAEDISGYWVITDEQLREELPPTVDSMIRAFETGETEGPRQHSVGIIRARLTYGFHLPDLQMSLHALQTAVMRIVMEADLGVEKELEALNVSSTMYYLVALIAAEVYEQLRAEQQRRFATAYEFGLAMSSSLNMDEVVHTAVAGVAEYTGADSVAIMLLQSEDKCYELRAYHNLDSELASIIGCMCKALGCGKTYSDICKIPDIRKSERVDKWAEQLASHDRLAMVCTPLYSKQAQLGRLVVMWSQPHEFSEPEIDFLLALSTHIANAVQNASLYEEARGKHELDTLLTASRQLASTLDTRDILTRMTRMAAEVIQADLVVVCTRDHQEEAAHHTAYYADSRMSTDTINLALNTIAPSEAVFEFTNLGQEFIDGKPLMLDGNAVYPDGLVAIADVVGSTMVIPLMQKDVVIGAFFLISLQPNAFNQDDLALATGLAGLAAVAIENARLYEHQLHIAETLQRSFLPATLPSIDGYEVAAYYRPARAEAEVGGDFYDLFTTSNGCVGIIIGDVSGKGLQASIPTAMGKYMTRAYVTENPSPGSLLTRLNRAFYENITPGMFMTALYATLDPRDNVITYASAGHNPPLLFSAASNKVAELPIEGISLAIVAETKYVNKEIDLKPGDALLLYTDGATDVKDDGKRLDIEGLEEIFLSCAHKTAEEIIRDISDGIWEFSHGRLPDDVALVVVKREI